jgi:hypothetical protein
MVKMIEIGPFNDELDGYEQIGLVPKPLTVACRCGWEGEDRQLIRANKHERQRYCPGCGRQFEPFPQSQGRK